MNSAYLLVAKRDPDRMGGLKIGYPTKEHAIAAVDVIRHLWGVITVTAPDGSLVLHFASPQAQAPAPIPIPAYPSHAAGISRTGKL